MITGVTIERLRGIRAGEVRGLTPLTIVVGPNGSGKSAILDALVIGAAPDAGDAVGRAVRRRVSTTHGARWLLWKRGDAGPARIVVDGERDDPTVTEVSLYTGDIPPSGTTLRIESWPRSAEVAGGGRTNVREWTVTFKADNDYDRRGSQRASRFVRLIDPAPGANQEPLWRVYDRVLNAGHKQDVLALLADVVPDFDDLTMSAEDDGTPTLRLLYRSAAVPESSRGVPVGLAGDGVVVLTRIALELAACRSGLALLEEPEVHQYPKTLWRIAQAILGAVKRDVQVVVTTHSDELIRMLLGQAEAVRALDAVSVVKVKLAAGSLVTSQLTGSEAWIAIDRIGDDLR